MILIVGCGFLGSYLLKHIKARTDEKVVVLVRNIENTFRTDGVDYVIGDITYNDTLKELAVKCAERPLTVFYFAACHNIDYVYECPDFARKVNIDALNNFFEAMPRIDKLFFASTDCVYGEGKASSEIFDEGSLLNPVNEYGKQKIEAEKIVLSKGFNVLRFPFMMGPSLTSKKHFYDIICDNLKRKQETEMIDGMRRSVLSFSQTASIIYSLSTSEHKLPSVINVCSDNELSKYEIGLALAEKSGADAALIKCISEEEGRKFFKDNRASVATMDNSLLKSLLGVDCIRWDEA